MIRHWKIQGIDVRQLEALHCVWTIGPLGSSWDPNRQGGLLTLEAQGGHLHFLAHIPSIEAAVSASRAYLDGLLMGAAFGPPPARDPCDGGCPS